MRSRTSEPGSISQKRARSKSGPSGGTTTLNRVTATVPLKSPIVACLLLPLPPSAAERAGILADGRGRRGRSLGRISGRRILGGRLCRGCRRRFGGARVRLSRSRAGLGSGLGSGGRILRGVVRLRCRRLVGVGRLFGGGGVGGAARPGGGFPCFRGFRGVARAPLFR